MKKVIAALMTVLFLGSAGLVLAQTPAPAAAAPAATPMPMKKKHKKKKKAMMEATPVAADASTTPAAK